MEYRGLKSPLQAEARSTNSRDTMLLIRMVGPIKSMGLLCLAAGIVVQAVAQDANVLRVNTRLVEVDVVVHSKGQAVADLKQEDFTVFDNRKPQKVAAFNIISSRTT